MTTGSLRATCQAVFLALFALLPFELPIAEGIHGVLRDRIGDSYPVFFIGTILLVASAVVILTQRVPRSRLHDRALTDYLMLALVFVSIGLYAFVVTLLHDAWVDNSARQLVLGHLAPAAICLAILLLDPAMQRRAWAAFYTGYVAFLVVSLLFLAVSYRAAQSEYPSLFSIGIGQRLFMWRFSFGEPWNVYATYIGNANKTSNNLLVFMLLAIPLLGRDAVASRSRLRRIVLAFWALGSFTLILLFSRAALLLFPFVAYASGILPFIRRRTKVAFGVVALASIVIAFSAYRDAFSYLLLSRAGEDTSVGFLGTYSGRVEDIKMVTDLILNRTDVFLGGLGTSGFSMLFFGDETMGTHNTFLDTFVESGIGGFALLLGLMVLMVLKTVDPIRMRFRYAFGLFVILVLTMLMTREHSFAYLYATSLGGFCFTATFLLLAQHRGSLLDGLKTSES